MTKGFALTMDAALAVVAMIAFILALAFLSAEAKEDPYGAVVLQKQADDALLMLDKTGVLATLNATTINNTLNQTLPRSLVWSMEVRHYNYSNGFNQSGSFSFGSNFSRTREGVSAQREFLVFGNRTVRHYGIARLRLWSG